MAFNIPALLEEVCDDAPPSLAWRMASFALWASGGAIVGTALAVAWSQ